MARLYTGPRCWPAKKRRWSVFFLFDLLHLDGESLMALPLVDRKTRLAPLLNGASDCLRYNDHQIGHGPAFHRIACEQGVEGIVSKRGNGRYEPDRRTSRALIVSLDVGHDHSSRSSSRRNVSVSR